MSKKNNKQKVLEVLRLQKLAVIATTDLKKPSPESALIAFAEDDDLNLYFQTGTHTRKAANLRSNPHISLVIGLSMDLMITVQYEGTVRQLEDSQEIERCKRLFLVKDSPTTPEYLEHLTTTLFKVTPTWIGCSDYRNSHREVIEIKSF